MASKGGSDDSSKASTKNVKPSYDGKVSTWEAFSIKGENYIRRKGTAMVANGADEDSSDGSEEWQPVTRRRPSACHAWVTYGSNPQPATKPPSAGTSSEK